MKTCCKDKRNWKHNGARNKKTQDLGKVVRISYRTYIECTVCGELMFMLVNKEVVPRDILV